SLFFFFHCSGDIRDLHSFPTRRSSDLFAGGLTKEVGDFSRGVSRQPLQAGDPKLGVFICYESIFPDDVRQFANQGAQVLVNISKDRKSTRLNSSHDQISYAVFCLKKKK